MSPEGAEGDESAAGPAARLLAVPALMYMFIYIYIYVYTYIHIFIFILYYTIL